MAKFVKIICGLEKLIVKIVVTFFYISARNEDKIYIILYTRRIRGG